jgi:hypothetical protein
MQNYCMLYLVLRNEKVGFKRLIPSYLLKMFYCNAYKNREIAQGPVDDVFCQTARLKKGMRTMNPVFQCSVYM